MDEDRRPGWIEDAERLDLAIYAAVARTPTPTLDVAMSRLSRAADYSRLSVSAAALLALAGRRGRRAATQGLVSLGVTATVVNVVIKPLGRRRRPDRLAGEVPLARQVRMPVSRSFPSGHSAGAFAFATGVGHVSPAAAVPLRALAALVAYSRVHAGVHYPADVVIGGLIGTTLAQLTVHATRASPMPSGRRRGRTRPVRYQRDQQGRRRSDIMASVQPTVPRTVRQRPRPKPVEHPTPEKRAARGKEARATTPRSVHGEWAPAADRFDPVELLEEQAASRVPELVPIRYGRMLVSPFTFFRGAAYLMAADLAGEPRTGLEVQLCGDAHLSNFGAFAAPDRRLVFSINDFDETLPGPFEWDVKRLVASFAVAGRDRGFDARQRQSINRAVVRSYREAMQGLRRDVQHRPVVLPHRRRADRRVRG